MYEYDVIINGLVVDTFKSYEDAEHYLICKYGINYNMYDCGIVRSY